MIIARSKLLIFTPAMLAIAFSILAVGYYGFERIDFGDTEDYVNAANAFLNGTEYPRQSVFHPMFRPPLFPLLIAGVWSIFPQSIIAIKLTQALLHGATVFIVYKIVWRVLRKQVPALIGALVCAFNPLLTAHTVDFYTEPLHAFLCATAMLFVVRLLEEKSFFSINAMLAGVFFGLATLNRPAILGVAICLTLVIALFKFRDSKKQQAVLTPASLLICLFLTVAPWTIYNYRTTGELILVNDGFSYNLWLGNLPETLPLYTGGFKSKEENQRFADYVWGDVQRAKIRELEQTDHYSSLKLNEREKVWRREAIKTMFENRGITVQLMFGKLWSFWTPFLNPYTYGYRTMVLVALFVIATYIFGIYGAVIFAHTKLGKEFIILLLVSFIVTTAIHVLIFGFVRYRVPNVDPYLSMLTGVAIWHILANFYQSRTKDSSLKL